MSHYIDGFAFPIPRDRIDDYRRLAQAVAAIWIEHGALDYREFAGDDLTLAGTRSFADLLAASDHELIVFGWVAFETRQARDRANARVAADPRMAELFHDDAGFDAERMAYGGFESMIRVIAENAD